MNYIGNGPAPGGMVLVGDTNPVGAIAWFHAAPDATWLRLNGQSVLKASYPDLWAWAQGFLTADQTANPGLYRSIDGTTFALPKLDGLFIRSAGQVDASHVALALGVKQGSANISHAHGIRYVLTFGGGGGLQAVVDGTTPNTTTALDGATESRPVNVALVPCVKALRSVLLTNPVQWPPGTVGRLLQAQTHARGDYATSALGIPQDDTIPQITEGVEWFSVTITPQIVGSRIMVKTEAYTSADIACASIVALFRGDQPPNAIAVAEQTIASSNYRVRVVLSHEFISPSLSPITVSARFGHNGGANLRLNGTTVRAYGGASTSFLRVEEYAP